MKQIAANNDDLKIWDMLVRRFDGAFGSTPSDTSSVGLTGDLWVMVPCDEGDMKLMWDATGMRKEGDDCGYRHINENNDLTAHFQAYKFKRGIWRKPLWLLANSFLLGRVHEVRAGFFAAATIADLGNVIDQFLLGELRPKSTAIEALQSL